MRTLGAVPRPPLRLADHVALGVLIAAALLALVWRLRRGWGRRVARFADLPPLPAPPAAAQRDRVAPLPGLLLGTTTAGEWLDRVATQGLGGRGPGELRITEGGVRVDRAGAASYFIPASALRAVRSDHAHAGRAYGADRVLVVTWEHGERLLDLGLRPRDTSRLAEALTALTSLAHRPDPHPDPPPSSPFPPSPPRDLNPELPAVTSPSRPDPLTAPLAQLVTPAPRGGASLIGRAPTPAVVVLEDGRAFRGEAWGASGETFGEAVFATGMTGYQETFTDPSYHRQVLVMTAPQIGNTGMNDEDPESGRLWIAGLVVRQVSRVDSNWRSRRSLDADLARGGVVGVSEVDTRALTRHLRERGAMRIGLSTLTTDVEAVLSRVREHPPMIGADLPPEVSTPEDYVVAAVGERRHRVVAVDLGLKAATPRYLARQGCEVHVVPARSTAAEVLAHAPDGVFFSNGPGDPAASGYAVATMRGVLDAGVPLFGICMGNQILGRALGLGTYKLRYGHRGVNQPVADRATGRVAVTSHNHGFAVDAPTDHPSDTPYGRVEVSHVALNDGVVEGLVCRDVPAFSVQYHPEAAPGPHDATGLFPRFAELMTSRRPLAEQVR